MRGALAPIAGCLLLLLLLSGPPAIAQGAPPGPAYRTASPFYIRHLIPDDPGSLRLLLADGSRYNMGFMGTATLSRIRVPTVPIAAQFISTPGEKWNFGIAFYQGSPFNMGLPRRYLFHAGNRYTSDAEAFGKIRLVLWNGKIRYEVQDGSLDFTRFKEERRRDQFRLWRVTGTFVGTLVRADKWAEAPPGLPPRLNVREAAFECLLIEDRDPVPNTITLTFDKYYLPALTLPVRAEYFPEDTIQALSLNASRTPESARYIPHEFLFQVRQAGNVPWPLKGEYELSAHNVDPTDLFTQGRSERPLVMALIYRPQQDVELHYMPTSGFVRFESAQLLSANEQRELWRVKGRLQASLKLEDRKMGIGNVSTRLAIDPALDLEVVKIIEGSFDIRVLAPAVKVPAWKRQYPNLDPQSGGTVPHV